MQRSDARGLADRVLAGEMRAAARLMRLVDDEVTLGLEVFAIVHREGPESRLIGITGAPGSGKSTVVDQLITHHRRRGERVGVVAVDPSSPITGGAVLADRVRMQQHTLDAGVFVRSLASRGHRGGLSRSASATARILEAMGFEVVLIETVGTGQSDVDIARVADSVVVLVTPGMGDDVQAMKAGVMEIPDIFVVNKADRAGADLVTRDLEAMIHLKHVAPDSASDWVPPVVKMIASTGEGIDALVAELARHRLFLEGRGLRVRRLSRARLDVEGAIMQGLRASMLAKVGGERALDESAERIRARTSDPWSEARRLLSSEQ